MKIGLLLIATGKYGKFIPPLVESADEHFLKNHDVTYYLFSDDKRLAKDKKRNFVFNDRDDIEYIHKTHEAWPYPTLLRYKEFVKHAEVLKDNDYLFYCDADMLFVGEVGDEILGERVVTTHPGFILSRGTPETNPESTACIYDHEPLQYYAGGFNGGSSTEFLRMSEHIANNIDKDLQKDIIALWHDESHLNRYFVDNTPTVVLSPSYCYPEHWNLPFEQKLLSLMKDNAELHK
tara:strand:- start:7395 stop:8099 length:705 start_codon:yes stop_codon:yes gene_type:complete